MNFIQEFITSRKNNVDGVNYIGKSDRLWYDPTSNSIRIGDGTPGGKIITASSSSFYGGIQPNVTTNGAMWFDTVSDSLKIYNETTWSPACGPITIIDPQNFDVLVYNSINSSFESTDLKLSGGLTNQVLIKKSDNDFDYAWETAIEPTYFKLVDQASSTIMYYGESVSDSLPSDSTWRIQKILLNSFGTVTSILYAGDKSFSYIWNNRLSLSYS